MGDDDHRRKASWIRAASVLILALLVVVGLIALISGATFWPESAVTEWAWRAVWLVIVPILLIASYVALTKKK